MSNLFPDPLGGGPNPFEDNGGLADDPVYQNSEPPSPEDRESSAYFPARGKKSAAEALRRYYTLLVVGGLIVGAIVSFGVVKAIHHFGLNDVPAQVE